ncbi:MAG: hypothetical protein ACXIUB_10090 [Wenzhouxiangella sp.]
MVLLRVLTFSLAAVPLWAASNDTVFTDRFATGIQKALVNEQTAWWRRGNALAIELPCGQAAALQIQATANGAWDFTFDTLPEGITETGNGQLAVTLGCQQPDPPVFSVSAVSSIFEITDSVALVLTGGALDPETPVLFGVDLAGDGGADITNNDGELTPDLEWIKDFPLESTLLGDASAYSSSLGSVNGSEWTFTASESGPYALTAQRDGLEDSADGNLNLREALVTSLGEFLANENEINILVTCGEAGSKQFSDNLSDLVPVVTTTYVGNDVPSQVTINSNGLLDYDFSCAIGSTEFESFTVTPTINAQGNSQDLEDIVVNISVDGVAQPQAPSLYGIMVPPITNDGGELSPDLTWIKDFPGSFEIDGDASSYSSSIGSVTGNTWTFNESNSGPYTLTAHRDGLQDSATGQLELIEAQVAALGNVPVVRVGEELRVDKELECGESYALSFSANTDSLEPSVGVTYSAATTLPAGATLEDGVLSYTPSCTGPDNAQFLLDTEIQAQGNTKGLEQVLVNMDITGTGSALQIFGLDYDFNGQVNNQLIPGVNQIENEVPYFCSDIPREMFILSNDPDNTTYTILEGNDYAFIDPNDNDLLILGAIPANNPDCAVRPIMDSDGNVETPGGLENTVVIQATSPLGSKTFSVDTRGYSPMITHVRVEPAPTSGGTPRDPYVAQFDSNMFSEMINLSYDRPAGIPHRMYLEPVIPFDEVDLMRPTRGYVFEHNNQPFWMSLDMFDGVIDASPTASDAGFVFPWPEYKINVGSTQGPNVYKLEITVTDD